MSIEEQIDDACRRVDVFYDVNNPPIKLTPGCYLFYATELNESCRSYGHCNENVYYALTGGRHVTIMKELD